MKRAYSNEQKRNHEVVAVDFFGEGENLEAWQLGWQQDEKVEAKSSVSKKIFHHFVEDMARNMIFYYLGDGNFYGIHAEECPTPVFRFKKEQGNFTYDQLGYQDTHDYAKGEILYMVPCDESVWDTVKIDGKSLEEVLQNSYIVNIS